MDRRPLNLTILACLLTGCAEPRQSVTIPFQAHYRGESLACESSSGAALSDLRFYVHDLRLIADDGRHVPVALSSDGAWQSEQVAMIDLENGRGACENGTSDTNASLEGSISAGEYTGIHFILGVPLDRNHSDPLGATPPLDDPAMHWHWRSGYKFLRAGVRTDDDSFWIHLGSTGCEGTVGAITGCSSANRVPVEIDDFSIIDDAIVIDLSALLAAALQDGVASDCSSGPAEAACEAPFAALGIEFPGGKLVESQRVFRKGDSF